MKIFVSSTYIDLIEYRKAVERAVNLLDQQFKGMEYFGARDEEPKVAALKNVEQCDVFVGVYAHRFGTIPDGETKSITEQEFDHARKIGKPILCYRVKPDQPWSPTLIERGDAENKLKEFLKRIEKDFVRQEFTTPEDLLAKVAADLSRVIVERGGVAVIAHPLPPVPYFVHTYPLQANFTGRAKERAVLTEWFTRDARAILAWVAIGGMGKSALAWVWTQEIFSLGMPVEGVLWWSFYDERDFGQFLACAIEYASGGALNPKSIGSDRERVDALTNLLRQKRFLFILDGFERVLRAYARLDAAYRGDEVDADAREDYRACADPNVGIFLKNIASGLSKALITTRLHPREFDDLNGVRREELAGMDAADAVEFFHAQGVKGARAEIVAAGAPYAFHPLTLRLLAGTLAQDPRYGGDIQHAPKINPLDADKNVRILEFAYNSLPTREQQFISQLSAFRSPLTWDALRAIFSATGASRTESTEKEKSLTTKNTLRLRSGQAPGTKKNKNRIFPVSPVPSVASFVFANEDELARTVLDLEVRGLYLRDKAANTYDLHPVIRRYCYDRLNDKTATHARLREYFAAFPVERRIESLADLRDVLELYHHTVGTRQYDVAAEIFHERVFKPLYLQLGAYQICIELLRALFPDGEESPPLLKREGSQWRTLDALGKAYSRSGQFRHSANLHVRALMDQSTTDVNLAITYRNLAGDHAKLGEFKVSDKYMQQSIALSFKSRDEFGKAIGYRELGRLLCYRGQFEEAEAALDSALNSFEEQKVIQPQIVVWTYHSLRHLFMGNPIAGLENARAALEIAKRTVRGDSRYERDLIEVYWLLGDACRFNLQISEAEKNLAEALSRCRQINLVDLEADVLLAFAHWYVACGNADDAREYADEALLIADRCEYRLKQAEVHNFFAEWWFAKAEGSKQKAEGRERAEALAKAKHHAERAKERAECDGPPHYYKVAYEKAERMLKEMADA